MKPKKRYCYTCGSPVRVVDRIWSYDERTGKPKTTEDAYCKNVRWWHIFTYGHPVTESDAYAAQAG